MFMGFERTRKIVVKLNFGILRDCKRCAGQKVRSV
jgi:hypothetical protein